jgi:hypothetical protein
MAWQHAAAALHADFSTASEFHRAFAFPHRVMVAIEMIDFKHDQTPEFLPAQVSNFKPHDSFSPYFFARYSDAPGGS